MFSSEAASVGHGWMSCNVRTSVSDRTVFPSGEVEDGARKASARSSYRRGRRRVLGRFGERCVVTHDAFGEPSGCPYAASRTLALARVEESPALRGVEASSLGPRRAAHRFGGTQATASFSLRRATGTRDDEVQMLQVGKAQESNGRGLPATVGGATDSRVEQGLVAGPGSHLVTARGQRSGGDAVPATREGKALKGRASWGKLAAMHRQVLWRSGNPMNPMVGSGMQQARKALGGATRQGGEKPRRRPVWRTGSPSPKPSSLGTVVGEDSERDVDGGAVLWTTLWKALGHIRWSRAMREASSRVRRPRRRRAAIPSGRPARCRPQICERSHHAWVTRRRSAKAKRAEQAGIEAT